MRRVLRSRPVRWAARVVVWAAAVCVLWAAAYRLVNPPITYLIASEWIRLGDIQRDWRSLDEIAPDMARAAVAAEDARFCDHWGIDPEAVRDAIEDNAEGGRVRGGSTITQQVAKNVFLWPGRSWTRKGLEAVFALLIEALWPKRRILEVYLNVAETGKGAFGVEAAAQRYFGVDAAKLTLRQASLIAAALPNPKKRSPARPSGFLSRRASAIAQGAETLRLGGGAACLGLEG